jgi:hypothetical protein
VESLEPIYRDPEREARAEAEALEAVRAAANEQRVRWVAAPAALALCVLLVHTGMGHWLIRTFFSMWVHESGHALSAWFFGIPATPGPWITHSWQERSPFFVLMLIAAQAALARWAWRNERRNWLWPLGAVFAVQMICTLAVPLKTAHTWVTFFGDGGAMLGGALLMCTFYVGPENTLRRGGARWGLLVFGAASLADVGTLWWQARTDPDVIPFGTQEYAGLSDPSRLVEWAGWSVTQLVHRYVAVAVLSVAIIAVGWALGIWRARGEAERTA